MIVEKHSRMPRKYTPGASPKRITTPGKAVAPEVKAKILEDAKAKIMAGESLAQIAHKHGIAERTLEYWLSALGEEYKELRQAWIDNMLSEARDLLKNPGEDDKAVLRLAKGRELWKSATWYAERRDKARYGQEQTQAVVVTPVLHITISDPNQPVSVLAPRAHARMALAESVVVDAVPQQSEKAVTDQ